MPAEPPKTPEQNPERKQTPPASIESEEDQGDERRRVGPEDEDRRLRDGERRPLGQMP